VIVFVLAMPLTALLTPDVLSEESKQIIVLTNDIRTNLNIEQLIESQTLNDTAFAKAQDMLINQYFAHIDNSNRGLSFWLAKANYDYAVAGENLAMGFSDAASVVKAWTESPTHYANLIDPDYSEIGAGMTSGLYHEIETTLTAQYFGARQNTQTIPTFTNKEETIELNNEEAVENDNVLAVKDFEQSAELIMDQPVGKNEIVLKATAYLADDTVTASIDIKGYNLKLAQIDEQTNKWSGSTVLTNTEQTLLLDPIVPASIETTNTVGTVETTNVDWKKITPLKTSLIKQYIVAKSFSRNIIEPFFNLNNTLYQLLLVITFIGLLLHIFIKIRQHDWRITLSSLGFIWLLILLIII